LSARKKCDGADTNGCAVYISPDGREAGIKTVTGTTEIIINKDGTLTVREPSPPDRM